MDNVLDDERLQAIEQEREKAQTDATTSYDNMINDSQKYYDKQIDAIKNYENTQKDLQQQQTDLTLEKINQQKSEAVKDYEKEQKSSYIDYQKGISQFGELAEQMASQGISNSGVSENARTQMYVAFQSKVASAKESLNKAVLNYNNSAKEAQLANSVALAEIASSSLQQQLQISLQAFQYKNSLLESKQAQLNNIDNRYDNKYSEVLSQLQRQKELEENMRQWQKEFDEKVRQYDADREYRNAQLAQSKLEADRSYQIALAELELSRKKIGNESVDLMDGVYGNSRADEWINSMRSIERSKGRTSSEREIVAGVAMAIQQGALSEEEGKEVLQKLGYE